MFLSSIGIFVAGFWFAIKLWFKHVIFPNHRISEAIDARQHTPFCFAFRRIEVRATNIHTHTKKYSIEKELIEMTNFQKISEIIWGISKYKRVKYRDEKRLAHYANNIQKKKMLLDILFLSISFVVDFLFGQTEKNMYNFGIDTMCTKYILAVQVLFCSVHLCAACMLCWVAFATLQKITFEILLQMNVAIGIGTPQNRVCIKFVGDWMIFFPSIHCMYVQREFIWWLSVYWYGICRQIPLDFMLRSASECKDSIYCDT